MKKLLRNSLAAALLLSTPLMSADRASETSLNIGMQQISVDDEVYGELDDLSISQLILSMDHFHLDGKLNSHMDFILGGGDVFYPALDFGLRYQLARRLGIGVVVGYGIHEILKDGEKVDGADRESIALAGLHYGADIRYLLGDTFVLGGGYKIHNYTDIDADTGGDFENSSLYAKLGFYW